MGGGMEKLQLESVEARDQQFMFPSLIMNLTKPPVCQAAGQPRGQAFPAELHLLWRGLHILRERMVVKVRLDALVGQKLEPESKEKV